MRWYLVHVWRQRVDYPTLKSNVLRLAKEHGAQRVLVEDTSAGTALVQDLRSQVAGIIAVKPEGDKLMRMSHRLRNDRDGSGLSARTGILAPRPRSRIVQLPGQPP